VPALGDHLASSRRTPIRTGLASRRPAWLAPLRHAECPLDPRRTAVRRTATFAGDDRRVGEAPVAVRQARLSRLRRNGSSARRSKAHVRMTDCARAVSRSCASAAISPRRSGSPRCSSTNSAKGRRCGHRRSGASRERRGSIAGSVPEAAERAARFKRALSRRCQGLLKACIACSGA
jgi:hypothetical protein